MNHLAHFRAGHPEPALISGGLLGDFIKGRLVGKLPHDIERGVRLHRAIDAFSDHHPIIHKSVGRFEKRFRRFAPIIIDIIYDHFLARDWSELNDTPLCDFCDSVFEVLEGQLIETKGVPDNALRFAERMVELRSLTAYGDEAFVQRSLSHLSTRIKRDNPIAEGFTEFQRLKLELFDDFRLFYPELVLFAERWRQEH